MDAIDKQKILAEAKANRQTGAGDIGDKIDT